MASERGTTPRFHIRVLGAFRVERVGVVQSVSDWRRRSAKTLTKLLVTSPGHALHREQILDVVWPGVDVESALNSFGKALHAARRAFEPELQRRENSAFFRLVDSMLVFDTEHVVIDADRFERMAEDALRHREIAAYESALKVYAGDLLLEDRYEDWCAERRSFLAELRIRLLLGLAEALEASGAYIESGDRLRDILRQDPTRETVHRAPDTPLRGNRHARPGRPPVPPVRGGAAAGARPDPGARDGFAAIATFWRDGSRSRAQCPKPIGNRSACAGRCPQDPPREAIRRP